MTRPNIGLYQAIGKTLHPAAQPIVESTSAEPAYHADYNSTTGSYSVKHRESGRTVAHNVAVSGGAAMAAADRYNSNPKLDRHEHPTMEDLHDAAESHNHMKTAQRLLNTMPLHSYAAAKGVDTALESHKKNLDTLHTNFARHNPDHEFADRKAFDEHHQNIHTESMKDMVHNGDHL